MNNKLKRMGSMALLATALGFPAYAEVGIVQIYSSPDGEYQAVLLEDDRHDGVDRFRGITLVMQDAAGSSRTFTLSGDRLLDGEVTVDGRRRFLVATRSMSRWLHAQAELPDAFVETNGGTLSLFGKSSRAYGVLDEGGAVAFDHRGNARASNDLLARHPKAPRNDAAPADADHFALPAPAALVREYRATGTERYRLAITQSEKAELDTGVTPGWDRTGRYFRSLDASAGTTTVPVCRYRIPTQAGERVFLSAFESECDVVPNLVQGAVLETADAFRAALPDSAGACPAPRDGQIKLQAIYRSWNPSDGASHRYTTNADEQIDMMTRGWIAEGYGPLGTAMCVESYDLGTIAVEKGNKRNVGTIDKSIPRMTCRADCTI
ncbi:MAG TPA: hypothetical protein VNG69_15285 [Casimicrobiaceae bacterium]|nr:hypothetical protein [Casimicrobiaceae bacterium]